MNSTAAPRLRAKLTLISLLGAAVLVAAHAPRVGAKAREAATSPASAVTTRLPTGATLDPAGRSIELGSMPLGMALSPDSTRLAIVLSGHRDQGVQIVDPEKGVVLQTLIQPAAFLGAAFSPDGRSLFVSGGNQDLIYRYAISGGAATLADSIRLDASGAVGKGRRYPAGIVVSRDGRQLYVAENLADSLAVVNLASGRVTQRLDTGRYPYDVVAGPDGRVFVSAWGGAWIASFAGAGARLEAGPRIQVGRHPSALALDRAGARLYVARASYDRIVVVDTHANTRLADLSDAAPTGPAEGSTPNALALSADGRHLLVAEADNNAIAVYGLAGAARATGARADSLLGRVPVEWYPTGVMEVRGRILALNGKGARTGPNPGAHQPGSKQREAPRSYTLDQTSGSLTTIPWPAAHELKALSARVAKAVGWDRTPSHAKYPPFQHVIYVIRENRTYDQVMGDLAAGDGDTALVLFPRGVTPNAHALAERCGLFDRFFVNAEVSGDGHNWTTSAYASDYVEKTVASAYSDRGRAYDYDGLNRDRVPDDDVNEPGNGYLWDAALDSGATLRNYGEFTRHAKDGLWSANKSALEEHTDRAYPGWDLKIRDQKRADEWLREFQTFVAKGTLPALSIVWLPNDHTSGAKAGAPTPRAQVADNDLALGRMVEALSRSPYWKSTVMFVLEDDAQDGPDHVDSHRSPLLVISAYGRPGNVHRFANTSDVVATIADILHLRPLSQFDFYGRPLADVFSAEANAAPYTHLVPGISLDEKNPARTRAARASSRLDFEQEDQADADTFNRVLWAAVKGEDAPYPGTRRAPAPLFGGR
jgi:DNA-binding beta-propeller fold protein YncE